MKKLVRFFRGHPNDGPLKLHVGCGKVYFDGWTNIDIDSRVADKKHDLRKPLPYRENSVDFIYNEHFIEHVTVDEGLRVLSDFHRVLKPEGVLRIATPDLDYVIGKYVSPTWKDQDWIIDFECDWIQTKAEMLNLCFREWGHQYLYNEEELDRRLRSAGFERILRQEWHRSDYPELAQRETRKDSKLILEAQK